MNLTRTPISRAFEPEDANAAPEFGTWRWEKNENNRNIFPFTKRPGPTRVINGAANALDYFQLFYSDELFQNIVDFTNLNAQSKRAADREKHKGDWTDISLEELKAYYGISKMCE